MHFLTPARNCVNDVGKKNKSSKLKFTVLLFANYKRIITQPANHKMVILKLFYQGNS